MMSFRFSFIGFLLLALTACGGGGGGGGGSSAPTVVIPSSNSLTVTAVPFNVTSRRIGLTFQNVPVDGVFAGASIEKANSTISNVELIQTSQNTAELKIDFVGAEKLSKGEHTNQVAALFCLDFDCNQHIQGSPLIIDTTVISDGLPGEVSATQTSMSVSGNHAEDTNPDTIIIPFAVKDTDARNLYISIKDKTNGNLIGYNYGSVSSSSFSLEFYPGRASAFTVGRHVSLFEVSVCFDSSCDNQVKGSPIDVSFSYDVSKYPAGTEILNPTTRTEITHDIIDAEYSKALNAIVMVSSSPSNTLYVYHLDSGDINQIALNLVPTSVSVANAGDSSKIAVGHDAKITWIEYNQVSPVSSISKILNVPTDVFDLAASENAIYSVPADGFFASLYRIDVSDNSVTKSDDFSIYDRSIIKMHPSLQSIYFTNSNDIEKMDISVTPPVYLTNSLHQVDYDICDNLWISNDGQRIYTACGNTFSSSSLTSVDMTYAGKISLKSKDFYTNQIESMSESPVANEIAVIQKDMDFECSTLSNCFDYLSFFSKDFLLSSGDHAFDSVSVNGTEYPEKPLFVFYNADGSSVYVISTLTNIFTPKSYLLEIKR